MASLADKAENIDLDNQGGTDGGADAGGREDTKPAGGGDNLPEPTPDKPVEGGKDGSGKGSEASSDGDKKTDGDEGYIADEAESGDDDGEADLPNVDEKPKVPSNLPPDLQYVAENLPDLTVRGKDGKTYAVKTAGQLPEDFEFATKRAELLFNQALVGQETKAQELRQEYQNNQNQQMAERFAEAENADIRSGISALQRSGDIAKFKLQPDDPKFADDAGVKQAQEVIDHMNKVNQAYLQAYNERGGVLYHMDFKTAYNDLQATKPKTQDNAQDKEDKQRREVARSTAGSQGAPSVATTRPTRFRTMRDVIDSLDLREY